MNLSRLGETSPTGLPYYGPGFGPGYTPPFLPSQSGETFPASREHELPEMHVTGKGPWTYAKLALAAFGIYLLARE